MLTRTLKFLAAAAVGAVVAAGSASAAERATKDEAVAMVKKAVAAIKANGDKAYAEFTKKGGAFTDRDLYIVVYKTDGVVLAHGQNETFVGKNLSDAKDPDGKPFVAERIELGEEGCSPSGRTTSSWTRSPRRSSRSRCTASR